MDATQLDVLHQLGLAGAIIGAVVYMQRAQTRSFKQLAEIFRPAILSVKLDAEQADKLVIAIEGALDVREDVAAVSRKVEDLQLTVATLSERVAQQGKRLSSRPKSAAAAPPR